jgi:Asp-tRNA(Asn)/Glu-tRNA(Gln) amidotransferase A subunit family amidase
MLRKLFLLILAGCMVGCDMADSFDAYELAIPELQAAMDSGATTSEQLVRQYLERIEAFDDAGPQLNAMLYLNPHAIDEAAALDRERRNQGPRGPLHGIPIVLKDNYDTYDMPTTAASVAMAGFVPPDDAYQVRRLRDAGAVIIGKTNLHEFARGIETVSSLGGYTRNPYDPSRNPGGSSGGTAAAVAANFAAVGMGSDTCGSIRIPAANTNLFGLRVTQGLDNTDGIIPLSHTQDVAGPLARSMTDLVTVLDVTIEGQRFSDHLDTDALHGARLGLLVDFMETTEPYAEVSQVVRDAAEHMVVNGATLVEVRIDGLADLLSDSSVIDFEFTTDVARYFELSGAPVKSIEEVLASGQYHEALEARYQRSVERAAQTEEYEKRLGRREVIARLLTETLDNENLDALVYPTLRIKPVLVGESQTGSMCRVAAHSGLPAISLPAGFTDDGIPVGIELLARTGEDGRLVELGYAWEQASKPRRPPPTTPSLVETR